MRITLLAFGILHDHFPSAGPAGLPLDLPDGATVASLLDHCRALAPNGGLLWSSLAVAVNREYAHAAQPLADGDEVALLPPVSGGAGVEDSSAGEAGDAPHVRLLRERILARDIVPPLERPADGAVVIFDGIVRNHSRGRTTRYLEYEAYETMALAQMQDLARQALARFPIRNVALVHRLGRLAIGESSVLIAVFSAHRAAAFDACRFLIDTLKQTIPIWKKEIFTDGAIWAQGEPFPPQLTPQSDEPTPALTPAERSQ